MTKILRLESMVCGLTKKMMKRLDSPILGLKIAMPMLKTNLEWKIDHLEGVELEDRRHSADFRGQCLDHHHHQHKVQVKQRH